MTFPAVSQFRSDSPRCGPIWNGSAVAVTEAILRHYLPEVPVGSQQELGQSMSRRHRRVDGRSRHGVCPVGWCTFCSYLELKAQFIAVGYGRLTTDQIRAHALRGHALHLAGWYAEIRAIGPDDSSPDKPPRGRSDTTGNGRFRHSVVVWAAGRTTEEGVPETYIVGDPDFGGPTRPLPPYCEYDANQVERFYARGRLAAAYCLFAPSSPRAAEVGDGTSPRFGGMPMTPRPFVVTPDEGGRQRRSPYIRADNVIQTVPAGTQFRSAQTTFAGTNVGGSTTWRGDATGMVWMHDSVLRPV